MTRERFLEWLEETERQAKGPLEAARAAAREGDASRCAAEARAAAVAYLEGYLAAVQEEGTGGGCVTELLEAAIRHDRYFERVRGEAELLEAGGAAGADCGAIVEALKDVRMLSWARAGHAMGFLVYLNKADPRLRAFVVHSTTEERARSIFTHGALYSFNRCVEKGLLTGAPLGVEGLLDPRRLTDYVIFGIAERRSYGGEMVANSQRKGRVDEALEEDYRPSVRLFFGREDLEGLAGYEDDGVHGLMVRDEVALDLLAYAVFPREAALESALEAVREEGRRERLRERCLVAPAECCDKPMAYVKGTNELVAKRVVREQLVAERVEGGGQATEAEQ